MDHLRHWQHEQALAFTVEEGISDALKQALLAEFGRIVQVTRERLDAQLAQEQAQLKEANELLEDAENKMTALETQYQSEKEQKASVIFELEKKLAAEQERTAEFQRQIEKLEQRLEESITAQEVARTESAKAQLQQTQQTAHQMEVRAAVAEARVGELEKQVKKA